jgi:hypothetical protein
MKTTCLTLAAAGLLLMAAGVSFGEQPPNPKIDYQGFRALAKKLDAVRQQHRLSEADFIRHAAEPGAIVLDARSRDKYEQIHVKGTVHLAFTDFTQEALAKSFPTRPRKS